MNKLFKAHRTLRKNLTDVLQKTNYQELLIIPDGFNNNIYWNIAHCVATQQLLVYYLSGNSFRIDKYWIETYKKGTLPNLEVSTGEIEDLHFLLTETSRIMVKDYHENFFLEYTPYSTSIGMELENIEDAILFNNLHESLHIGYIMGQKRALIGENY
ncbi:DinB family protein [Elizabethkingia argentiflava]|uniref:DinB family protein n=1 Tax=Elizabethkingia argenteiflava TaxID=2681556 RepID=A0A845PUR6_9FLAO|nr:DinB family protein [Elizabethkingia argenteiflava]NAW50217.1 DinB family protein [Elizabethkingia argenteiflava]